MGTTFPHVIRIKFPRPTASNDAQQRPAAPPAHPSSAQSEATLDLITRMADLIVHHIRTKSCCTIEDLRAAAFSEWQLERHGSNAVEMAKLILCKEA